ncbi:MAG: restriction endonuclease subunit S [Leucobacter sp.]
MTEVPKGWVTGPLRKFAPLQRGFDLPTTKVVPGGFPVVYSNGVGRFHNKAMINGPGVVTGRSGTIGRVHFVERDYWPHNTALWVTSFKTCAPKFAYYLLQSVGLERFAGGSGVPTLNRNDAHAFEICVPANRQEQARIVEVLTDADDLIATLERLIAKKQAIKQGMMQQLLTGKTRLPGFTGEWKTASIADQSVMKARIGWQGLKTDEYKSSGEYSLVGGTDFVDGRVDWSATPFVDKWRFEQDRYIQLRVGDVLLTKDGSIGKTAYVDSLPRPATLNSGVFVIRPVGDAYDSRFFYLTLRSRVFEEFLARLSAGSTISHLYQRDLVTLELELPPTLAEQRAIADAIFEAESEVALLRQRLMKVRSIKQGMMQQLLTGRTRLPVDDVE